MGPDGKELGEIATDVLFENATPSTGTARPT